MGVDDRLAGRVAAIGASGIRRIFDLAANLKDPIDLSIGQPHYDVPVPVKRAATAAIDAGFNRYTASGGISELRTRIGTVFPELVRDGREIMVTSGVSGGIVLALLALVDPGDEVLIPDPGFVSYQHVVRMLGGIPVFWDTYPDFRFHAERIPALVTPRTKVIIVNSPSNPTGMVYTAAEIAQAAALCRAHGIIPIADETYRSFAYDHPAVSLLDHFPDTVVLRGFSKDYAMTGWRMGYVSASPGIVNAMIKLQQFTFVNAPSFAQKACLTALDVDISAEVGGYVRKRDLVYEGLRDAIPMVRPEGAFYCFPRAPWGTGTEFVMRAVEENLLMVPGGAFSRLDTHFRISFAASDDKLEQGIAILRRIAAAAPRP
ncbi:MAG: aminotransferase class I/II-fold pyridoxal phosphate-dependent enzyme [Planctomycetota bacterium]